MGLDISLRHPSATCPTCGHTHGDGEIFDANYTHNVTPMWSKAGVYEALYRSDGKLAREILPALESGYQHMRDNPNEYIPLNPPNGWGSYDSALPWLEKMLIACRENPDAVIRACP